MLYVHYSVIHSSQDVQSLRVCQRANARVHTHKQHAEHACAHTQHAEHACARAQHAAPSPCGTRASAARSFLSFLAPGSSQIVVVRPVLGGHLPVLRQGPSWTRDCLNPAGASQPARSSGRGTWRAGQRVAGEMLSSFLEDLGRVPGTLPRGQVDPRREKWATVPCAVSGTQEGLWVDRRAGIYWGQLGKVTDFVEKPVTVTCQCFGN